MSKNRLEDMRNHLFAAMERLNDETLTVDQIAEEIKKANALASLGNVLVSSAKVELDYMREIHGVTKDSKFFNNLINNQMTVK